MTPQPTQPTVQLPASTISQVVNTIQAVEAVIPTAPGTTKAQIVLQSIQAGVALAPTILQLINSFVGIFNQLGIFKHSSTSTTPAK